MAEGVLLLLIGVYAAPMLAVCGRGTRSRGPSWFDIPKPTNRAARRS